MIDIQVIASSSSGNCYRLTSGKHQLLLEAGVSIQQIKKACGYQLGWIDACLISHAHADHSQSAAQLIKAGVDVYMSAETARALGEKAVGATVLLEDRATRLGRNYWTVKTFPLYHDAPCIGFLIYVFLKWPWKRWLICVLCMAAGFLIAYTGTKKMITLQSDYTAEQYDTYQFPYVHWVMMSLGPNGRYNQDDVDYTLSFNSMDAKKQADMKVIQERVSDMGLTGLLEHGLYEKVYHAWTQGALSADDYVHRQPLSTGIIRQIFALDGKYYKGYLLYAQAYWLLIISGMILSAVRYFKNREMCQIHGIEITIFGLFVFLLLWESNPRYLMHFLLMFCIVSAYGYGIIRKTKQGKQNSEKLPN